MNVADSTRQACVGASTSSPLTGAPLSGRTQGAVNCGQVDTEMGCSPEGRAAVLVADRRSCPGPAATPGAIAGTEADKGSAFRVTAFQQPVCPGSIPGGTILAGIKPGHPI